MQDLRLKCVELAMAAAQNLSQYTGYDPMHLAERLMSFVESGRAPDPERLRSAEALCGTEPMVRAPRREYADQLQVNVTGARRVGDVEMQLSAQTSTVNELESITDRLSERLQSVLRPTPSQPSVPDAPQAMATCPISNGIQTNTGRLRIVIRRLNELLDQVEV